MSGSHGAMFHSRKNDFPFYAIAPQGVVRSYTAYASDSNTFPPPTSPLPSLPLLRFLYYMLQGTGRRGRQPESLITRKRSHLALANSIPHKFAFPLHNIIKKKKKKSSRNWRHIHFQFINGERGGRGLLKRLGLF